MARSKRVSVSKAKLAKTGEELEIAFNYRFVQEFLNVIEDEQVRLKFNGFLSPAIFEAVKDPSFLHVIMPVRVQPKQE